MRLSRHLLIALAFFCSAFASPPTEKLSVESQVETYLKGIKCVSAKFVQVMSSGEIYFGQFWLLKKKKTKVKIKYTDGIKQDILIVGNDVTVIDNEKSKKYKYSISQTPIYSILTGSLNLSRENYEIIENSNTLLRLNIKKSSTFGGVSVTLVFSKYEKSGNVKNIEAWIIDDGKTEILFSFEPDSLVVNDEKKVPEEVFN